MDVKLLCPFMGRALCVLAGLFCILAMLFSLLWAWPNGELRDFGSFFASGQAAAEGVNPYGIYPLTFYVSTPSFSGFNPNLNPPTLLPVFQLLSYLPPQTALAVWWVVSILSCAAMLAILLWRYEDQADVLLVLWFLSLGGIWDTFHLGQVYLPLALLSVIAWSMLGERRDLAAGILIGVLAALKPNFLVWPVLLLLSRHYRCVLASAVAWLVVVLASVAMYGPTVYMQWLDLLASDSARAVFPTNGSLTGLFSRLGVPAIGTALSALLLLGIAAWAWIRRPAPLEASAVALIASLLASPIAWVHYSLFVLPILFAHWKRERKVLLLAAWPLVIPPVFVASLKWDAWWMVGTVGSIYTWTFLGIAYLALSKAVTLPVGDGAATRPLQAAAE